MVRKASQVTARRILTDEYNTVRIEEIIYYCCFFLKQRLLAWGMKNVASGHMSAGG